MRTPILLLAFVFASAACASSHLELKGSCNYSIKGSSITLRAAGIYNQNAGGHSGSLRIALWATQRPYDGGVINGWRVGEAEAGNVNGGYHKSNFAATVNVHRPPHGRYYMVMTLSEYDNGWRQIDYQKFPTPFTF